MFFTQTKVVHKYCIIQWKQWNNVCISLYNDGHCADTSAQTTDARCQYFYVYTANTWEPWEGEPVEPDELKRMVARPLNVFK